MRRHALIFVLVGLGTALRADPVRFSSGLARVSVLELFTSEGCSSCPPADQRLGALRTRPELWRDYVPIAFHVNYWDKLGWRDRLASPAATQRQYAYGQEGAVRSIYTPCFILDGAEWRYSSRIPGGKGVPGVLTVEQVADARWRIAYAPAKPPRAGAHPDWHAWVALLGGGLVSRVTDGENGGRTLRHEFVALAVAEHALAPDAGGVWRAEIVLPPPAVTDGERRALAAWLTRGEDLAPLQATGGWLPR